MVIPQNYRQHSKMSIPILLLRRCVFVLTLIRHYDVTGKQCPLYWSPTKYVSKETADGRFNAFKSKVAAMLGNSTESESFPYKVRITDTELNVRKDAGTNNPVVCVLKKGEVYTIVDL